MIKRNMHLPFLPLQLVPIHREAHAFGLGDVQGFDIIALFEVGVGLGDEVGEEVVWVERRGDAWAGGGEEGVFGEWGWVASSSGGVERGSIGALAVYRWEVDVDDFSGVRIDDGYEVQWVGVEVVMLREAGKEKTLLKALFRGESVVVADGPAVAADLLRENADVLRELLDTLVLPHNDLAVDELFHGYLGLSTLGEKICRVNHPFVISPGQDEIISVAGDQLNDIDLGLAHKRLIEGFDLPVRVD